MWLISQTVRDVCFGGKDSPKTRIAKTRRKPKSIERTSMRAKNRLSGHGAEAEEYREPETDITPMPPKAKPKQRPRTEPLEDDCLDKITGFVD